MWWVMKGHNWLRQTEHIRGHLWQLFRNGDDSHLTTSNHWFSSSLFISNPLLMKSSQERQSLEHHIN